MRRVPRGMIAGNILSRHSKRKKNMIRWGITEKTGNMVYYKNDGSIIQLVIDNEMGEYQKYVVVAGEDMFRGQYKLDDVDKEMISGIDKELMIRYGVH